MVVPCIRRRSKIGLGPRKYLHSFPRTQGGLPLFGPPYFAFNNTTQVSSKVPYKLGAFINRPGWKASGMAQKSRILLVGCGGVGTIAALNLEHGNKAEVSCVLRSNFDIVNKQGFTIRSCEHGDLTAWRPSQSQNPFSSDSLPTLLINIISSSG